MRQLERALMAGWRDATDGPRTDLHRLDSELHVSEEREEGYRGRSLELLQRQPPSPQEGVIQYGDGRREPFSARVRQEAQTAMQAQLR